MMPFLSAFYVNVIYLTLVTSHPWIQFNLVDLILASERVKGDISSSLFYWGESDQSILPDLTFNFCTKGGQRVWTKVYFRPWLLCRHRTRSFLMGGCNSVFPLHEWSSLLGKAAFCPALDWALFLNGRMWEFQLVCLCPPTTGSWLLVLSCHPQFVSHLYSHNFKKAKFFYELEEI